MLCDIFQAYQVFHKAYEIWIYDERCKDFFSDQFEKLKSTKCGKGSLGGPINAQFLFLQQQFFAHMFCYVQQTFTKNRQTCSVKKS